MATTSTYFWAMYTAIAISVLSIKVHILTRFLENIMNGVEVAGSYLMPAMPVFMFGIGAYIYGLPENVQEQVGLEAEARSVLLNPNPPKDTDGRLEESGRGVRELQGK